MSVNGTGFPIIKYKDGTDATQTVTLPQCLIDYKYYEPDILIKTSIITGRRAKIVKGYYHEFKVNLINIDSTLLNHLKAMRSSTRIEFYPHSSSSTYFLCILKDFEPYYFKKLQTIDACNLTFITESYVS